MFQTMAPDVRLTEEQLGDGAVPGVLPDVLVGRTKVWRGGRETVTEVEGLFPAGLLPTLDSGGPAGVSAAAWRALSSLTMLTVGLGARLLLTGLNTTVVHGEEHLEAALARPPGTALLSVTNHHSCLDDPGIWGALLSARQLMDTRGMRWGASASEVIFSNRPLATFWSLGKVVPIVRGWGVRQPAMQFLLHRLDHGGWVNIFPEGRVNWPREELRLRWGVGRLLAACTAPTLLLPVYHHGMAGVLPYPARPPRPGRLVTVCVGPPLDLAPLAAELRAAGVAEEDVHARLTAEVQVVLEGLGRQARAAYSQDLVRWLDRWHLTTDTTPSILT
jgi:monolysocardiolipin acyltransferase